MTSIRIPQLPFIAHAGDNSLAEGPFAPLVHGGNGRKIQMGHAGSGRGAGE